MGDFVRPDVVRLPLTEGAFIDIKRRLNHGEREDLYARWQPFITDGPAQIDRREVRTGKVLAYLVGWSLTDEGAPVPYALELPDAARLQIIRSLDPDRFTEIYTAIETHEAADEARRAEEKKTRGAAPGAAPT